jgi:anthranilate phosphoribosyltransferase
VLLLVFIVPLRPYNVGTFLQRFSMIREAIQKLSRHESLTEDEAAQCLQEIMGAIATPAQVGAYLSLLAVKGETLDEVVGSLNVMREKMVRVNDSGLNPIDVCGTGGDHKGTFNVSTTSAFVLAGGGVAVAKHGNRAASSKCGSAEVLQALGIKIDVPLRVVENCLKETGMCFLFAPQHHPAMKHVSPHRREIGIRTLFNLLGPMANPMDVKRQVVGVYAQDKAKLMAEVLVKTGSERVITFHGSDGMDEVSSSETTVLFEGKKDQPFVVETTIAPENFGLERHDLSELAGGDAAFNAKIIEGVLEGEKSARRDVVLMSAALGFYVAGRTDSLNEGVELAGRTVDEGNAYAVLERCAGSPTCEHPRQDRGHQKGRGGRSRS